MDYNDIVQVLAPCGLNCKKCMAFESGDIRHHSTMLKKLLGSFDSYAKRFSRFMPEFENYPQFKILLDHLSSGNCSGCRKGGCKYPGCGVAQCHTAKNVDFCFQCGEFPCDKSNLDGNLKARWITMNTRMKETGVERYYKETEDMPRYI